uniref:Eukaryotic translation initiation factor 4 gamma, 1a n=1 Tax=Anabas testudineus TaxID=64144 RepID=A0A7N6BW25_ANATE
MNKPPQPITGPTSVPNPAPSPGLTQAAYGPGQPPSLVFATPPPPQMNSAQQPRQGYYQNRPAMATSAPRVQTSSGTRPVGPTHVYPPTSGMVMISQQQLPFPGSPQGYFIPPGQYRAQYMPPAQQYPVTSGTASFYPGTSPAEYPPYAGAYYPAQPQYPPSVQPAPVMINPAQQQQQAPPPPQPPAQPQGPPKRERKPIRIRDPNQGGRDITEEIMSGGRSTATPTPPQASLADVSPAQTNGEVIQPVATVTIRDENVELPPSTETPPAPVSASTEPVVEAKHEMDSQLTPPTELAEQSVASTAADEVSCPPIKDPPASSSLPPVAASTTPPVEVVNDVSTKVSDTVDAPVSPSTLIAEQEAPLKQEDKQVSPASAEKTPEKEEKKMEEVKKTEKEEPVTSTKLQPAAEVAATVTPVNVATEETTTKTAIEVSQPLPPAQEPASPKTQTNTPSSAPEPKPVPAETAEPLLSNGLPQDIKELPEDMAFSDTTSLDKSNTSQSQESTPVAKMTTPAQEEVEEKKEEEVKEKSEDAPPASVTCPPEKPTMQAAVCVPKKKKNMKELNKKVIGDLLDAFTEVAKPVSEPSSTQADPVPVAPAEPPADAADETWEEKEDKQNAEPDTLNAKSEPAEQKYQYKEEQWKPINPEEKKRYDREFLLGFQFIGASMHKPEGLPVISDVVLDKVNKTPLRPADPTRLMSVGSDFTPSYLGNLGSRSVGGPRGPVSELPPGPRRSQQGRKEPRKIISSMSLNDDVQLNKAEKAWKPSAKKPSRSRSGEEVDEEDPEQNKTQELFKRLRSILNKLTPQRFQELMKQVTELTIDTEERLKGAIDLIFEKAILEPNFSLKVPTSDKPGVFVNFRKLLLNRCQKEFEKDQDDDEFFEKKQKEMEASKDDEERERLRVELEEARDKARRRSLGNIKFIGELFKLKMLTEAIMHDCVVKLLKNHDEESLECLCRLLSTIGKDLDFEKAKPRMDQYFNQMDKIIKERKTSSRIRFMLQDVLDLRRSNWVPRRGDQGPKTIDQIHKEAEMEEHREQIKVQQQLQSKKDGGGGRMGGNMGGRGPHTPGGGRAAQPQDEGWNTVPISKNRPIDTTRLSKITKPGALDFNNQLLAPGGKGMWGSWGKGSSGGTGAKPRQAPSTVSQNINTFIDTQMEVQMTFGPFASLKTFRSSSSRERGGDKDRNDRDRDRFDRFDRSESREDRDDRSSRNQITKRSFSRESQERGGRGGDSRTSTEPVRRVASMTDDRDRGIKRDNAPTPPPALPKPALTEEEVEKKTNAIIEEYLHINDLKEALQCVAELNSTSLLYVFVRNGVESTLERSTIAREHMGLLLHQLVKAGTLPTQQYYKGLQELLEAAEDMAIDIPHIWLYLAELITPMLHEGGIHMGQLFREISKPLVPLGKAGVLLVQILRLLCKGMVLEFTTGEETESTEIGKKKALSGEELSKQLDRLLQDKANNQRIRDWVEANLDEQQSASNQFIRALMTSVCQSAIICDNPYRVDAQQISQRASLLQRYLCDEQKELQALYALQALMVHMEQPANLLRMFFDALYDEDVIKEEAFYKWESSKDPAEQTGKGVALKSVTAFFTWLREAEEESDKE